VNRLLGERDAEAARREAEHTAAQAALRAEMAQVRAESARVAGEAAQTEARLRLLERSRSWRLTAPLRALTRWLGRS
jgi:hypothetical protein